MSRDCSFDCWKLPRHLHVTVGNLTEMPSFTCFCRQSHNQDCEIPSCGISHAGLEISIDQRLCYLYHCVLLAINSKITDLFNKTHWKRLVFCTSRTMNSNVNHFRRSVKHNQCFYCCHHQACSDAAAQLHRQSATLLVFGCFSKFDTNFILENISEK